MHGQFFLFKRHAAECPQPSPPLYSDGKAERKGEREGGGGREIGREREM